MPTSSEIVEQAFRLAAPEVGVEGRARLRTALRMRLKPSLEALAVRVSRDRSLRGLMRKSLGTVTVTAGAADLSALNTGTQPILLDDLALRSADIRHSSSGMKLQMLADRASLYQDRPTAFLYGAVEGPILFTRNTDGALDTLSGTLTVTANYIETAAGSLKPQLVPWLLEEMVAPWAVKPKMEGRAA